MTLRRVTDTDLITKWKAVRRVEARLERLSVSNARSRFLRVEFLEWFRKHFFRVDRHTEHLMFRAWFAGAGAGFKYRVKKK